MAGGDPRRTGSEKRRAVELFDLGLGYKSVATRLGIPKGTMKQWLAMYRAVGIEGLMKEDRKHARYPLETKLAVARAVVDDGVSKPEAMRMFGIRSASPVNRWCAAYSEGGAEALRPKPRGRRAGAARPKTREQELEDRVRSLEAEVAYLKKLQALEAAKRAPGKNAR